MYKIEKEDKLYKITINDMTPFYMDDGQVRHLIQILDSGIDVGCKAETKSMDRDEYMNMIATAKESALNDDDEDCDMCGA